MMKKKNKKKKKDGELGFWKFLYVTIAVYFTSFESTIRYITIRGDGYVSKKSLELQPSGFLSIGPIGVSPPSLHRVY